MNAIKKKRAQNKISNARPLIKALKEEYRLRPESKAKRKAYRARPEIRAREKLRYQSKKVAKSATDDAMRNISLIAMDNLLDAVVMNVLMEMQD
tara:strand:+ start:373 stop:654 length:282 start_codon:yes stop_codon:yes gene_type:complete